ncbi:RNA-directed DNA polymerase, eukaryota [Tanacetum coccineum]
MLERSVSTFCNPVRYERPNANPTQKGFMRSNDAAPGFRQPKSQVKVGSFANVVIGNRPLVVDSSPALVLDESCVVDRGLWVMIELDSIKSKEKFLHHDGVASWFKSLGNAQADFFAKELRIEESKDDLFARKRICIKTKQETAILDKYWILGQPIFWKATILVNGSPLHNSNHPPEGLRKSISRKVICLELVSLIPTWLLLQTLLDRNMKFFFLFTNFGVPVGGNMASIKAWDVIIGKLKSRLSKWKINTLSIGEHRLYPSSVWNSISREVRVLKNLGVDLISYCVKRIGNGLNTGFWNDCWTGDKNLRSLFPRIFALDNNKLCSVSAKFSEGLSNSLRRPVRGGVESHQLSLLNEMVSSISLSNSEDRWVWNLNGSGLFRVCDIRNLLDEKFLPKVEVATRWVKYIPIKLNIFAWRVCLDRLPTRLNLVRRDVQVSSLDCPICSLSHESTAHIFYSCSMASDLFRLICRWWDLDYYPLGSYADWLSWFKNIRMGSTLKSILEGVFFVSWWCVWNDHFPLLFPSKREERLI